MGDGPSELYQGAITLPVTAEKQNVDDNGRPFKSEEPFVSIGKTSGTDSTHVIISKDAGRVIENAIIGKHLVWGGELPGDIYGDTSFKGTRNENFRLEYNDPYGKSWRINGLSEYIPQLLERENRVSVILRENGLPTTRTREIYQINDEDKLPDIKGNYFPVKQWKELALKRLKRSLEKSGKTPEEVDNKMDSAKTWLTDTNFVIEVRDMQVDERLRGIASCKTKDDYDRMMVPIFKWLNTATQAKNSGLISGTEKPSPFMNTEDDMRRYFVDWLPKQMGTYVGRLQKLRLVHGNLTAQNWSGVGTGYDHDTMSGKLLEDSEQNLNFAKDVDATLGAVEELMNPEGGNYLSSVFSKKEVIQAQAVILKSFMEEKYGVGHNRALNRDSIKILYLDKKTREWKRKKIPNETWDEWESLGLKSGRLAKKEPVIS